jgi:hypothetical protein
MDIKKDLDNQWFVTTPRAIQACAVAMVHFRAFGWLEADIPELERIWWTLHDKEGNQI